MTVGSRSSPCSPDVVSVNVSLLSEAAGVASPHGHGADAAEDDDDQEADGDGEDGHHGDGVGHGQPGPQPHAAAAVVDQEVVSPLVMTADIADGQLSRVAILPGPGDYLGG